MAIAAEAQPADVACEAREQATRERARNVEALLEDALGEMRAATDAARRDVILETAGDLPTIARSAIPSTDAVIVDAPDMPSPPDIERRSPRRRARTAMVALIAMAATITAALHSYRGVLRESRGSVASQATRTAAPLPAHPRFAPEPALAPPSEKEPVTAPPPAVTKAATTVGTVRVLTNGRRVFLDGRLLGECPAAFTVSCGKHRLQVGTSAKSQAIDVPCDGEIVIGKR